VLFPALYFLFAGGEDSIMLTEDEESFVLRHAYIPEHLVSYVASISDTEPFLLSNYLCYYAKGHLIFVGYPLGETFEEGKLKRSLNQAIGKFEARSVALISPVALYSPPICKEAGSDVYYRLELASLKIRKKIRNRVKRASRDLKVERSRSVTREHERLISEFFETHKADKHKRIFERIPKYVSSSPTSLVLNARDAKERLVAFDVVELASERYAFYQFNFLSRENYVPGASDLLFHEIIKISREEGKKYINMGLGIHEGVERFKLKWGGEPFLRHEACLYRPELLRMLGKLF
jgi:hypothetical protein